MSTKRLFVVTVETDILVVADSAEEAEDFAEDAHRDLESHEFGRSASEMTHLPPGWELDALPWGHRDDDSPDRTVRQWIDRGAAPHFRVRK